jgi:multiple antibiotic resistance protein
MTITTAAITLFLVMDPLGNIPVFLSILNTVAEKRRNLVLLREAAIAFVILTLFLFFGRHIMHGLGITQPALHIAGGIILFLIALKMIFPQDGSMQHERQIGEPFIVPMAIPMLAGPSALATVMLFATHALGSMLSAFLAVAIASLACTIILLLASLLRRLLGQRGLVALERLMGMILTTIAVQMFLTGIESHSHLA